ncbi:MAG TPA: BrnT family toxin [Acidobacteriaceae bacterium]|nr:BrnT family toxin [Acidobacteriaceae bacterium]
MEIAFDPAKNERNIRERGLPFQRAGEFDFDTAQTKLTFRNGEHRIEQMGYLDDRLHVLCSIQTKNGIRVISFRKANAREAKRNGFKIHR